MERRRTKVTPISRTIISKSITDMADRASTRGQVIGSGKRIYDETCPGRVFDLACIGLTQQQLATAFGVNIRTIEKWLREKEEFREMYDKGRDLFDHGVQQGLLQKALGYDVEEVKHIDGVDSQGRSYSYTTKTKKHYPGCTTAQIFWLKNMHRGEWADVNRQENFHRMDVNVTQKMEALDLSPEDAEKLRELAVKQLKKP